MTYSSKFQNRDSGLKPIIADEIAQSRNIGYITWYLLCDDVSGVEIDLISAHYYCICLINYRLIFALFLN